MISPLPHIPTPRRWPIILALFFIWPLGFYLLWRSNAFSEKAKKIITAVLSIGCVWFAADDWHAGAGIVMAVIIAGLFFWKRAASKQFQQVGIACIALVALFCAANTLGKTLRSPKRPSPPTASAIASNAGASSDIAPRSIKTSNGRLVVEMGVAVKEENGKLTVVGDTNLPDATNLLIWLEGNIAGETYQTQSKVAVENGKFSKAGFSYHGKPVPAGAYKVTVSMSPYGQPQSVKAAVGKGLDNLSGPLVKESDGGGKMVKQEAEITIGGRDAANRREQAENASNAYKGDLIALYRELMDFKDSENFRAFGLSEQGMADWKQRAEELKERKNASITARVAAGYLSQLGMEYAFKKGRDTDISRYCKKMIFEYTGNLDGQ